MGTKGKNLSELPKDMFAKQKPGKGKNEKTEKLKEIARMEAQIYRFAELLKEIRDDTVENVERKQARTDAEREESEGEVSEEEVEGREMMTFPITPRTCPWGGMANLSPTGCTGCMVSISPTTVRFVETSPTKDLRLSRDILQSGAMHMA